MSLPAIEISGLSKRYVIEHESRHDTLRDTLHHTARKLWRRVRWGTGFEREEFWALRDVSFSVQPGEVVGIIGRNGAGKSTLLKILSRITEPTSGKITLRGRVASLLEVGTGFHPDLTGRENIFLNGAILGMNRAEIRRKFDEIVAFAEVERFLDTPVKRYSSGMYVRLAFAVAAHLEPEILIVDEVLAVGDAAFQKKCLGKMQDVARNQGRTVLFVSHNEVAIRNLCTSAVLLQQGTVLSSGPAAEILARYRGAADAAPLGKRSDCVRDHGTGAVLLRSISLAGGRSGSASLSDDDTLVLRLETEGDPDKAFAVEATILTEQLAPILLFAPHLATPEPPPLHVPGQSLRIEIRLPPLASGKYLVSLQLVRPMEELYAHYGTILAFDFSSLRAGFRGWTFLQSRNQGCILAAGDCRVL